ncbi:MAG: efflux RND transporter periplasmic adaptor subunit [Bacteroidales bacterium]
MKSITLLLFPALILIYACGGKDTAETAPLEVAVTRVLQQDVELESEFTGQTFGKSDIQINPQVDGQVQSMHFNEGSMVTKGQLLYEIDPLPYQAKVNQAEADLAQAQADLAKAKSDLEMIEPLAKINAVSQREYVAAKSTYEAAKAKIAAAKAKVDNASIELKLCGIKAPITGLIGISKVRVGDYVGQARFIRIIKYNF